MDKLLKKNLVVLFISFVVPHIFLFITYRAIDVFNITQKGAVRIFSNYFFVFILLVGNIYSVYFNTKGIKKSVPKDRVMRVLFIVISFLILAYAFLSFIVLLSFGRGFNL